MHEDAGGKVLSKRPSTPAELQGVLNVKRMKCLTVRRSEMWQSQARVKEDVLGVASNC